MAHASLSKAHRPSRKTTCASRGARRFSPPEGTHPIETLRLGDLVTTRDHGPQPIRWIGSTTLSAETLAQFPEKRPVTMAAGALGDHGETTVSPAHRVLLEGWRAEALFGETEVLASAVSLVNDTTIRRADVEEVEYVHILF
ncbi:MAG: Hint domain-containing protein [Pseudomonadota bacterium]